VQASPDGELVAYAVDTTGDEACSLHVAHVPTGRQLLAAPVDGVQGSLVWAPDGSALFYVAKVGAPLPDCRALACSTPEASGEGPGRLPSGPRCCAAQMCRSSQGHVARARKPTPCTADGTQGQRGAGPSVWRISRPGGTQGGAGSPGSPAAAGAAPSLLYQERRQACGLTLSCSSDGRYLLLKSAARVSRGRRAEGHAAAAGCSWAAPKWAQPHRLAAGLCQAAACSIIRLALTQAPCHSACAGCVRGGRDGVGWPRHLQRLGGAAGPGR
jgi:hypothetical protein